MVKYFFVSCVYNDTSPMKYFKYTPKFVSHAFTSEDYLTQEEVKSILVDIIGTCYEPLIILSYVEWSKEQYESYVK